MLLDFGVAVKARCEEIYKYGMTPPPGVETVRILSYELHAPKDGCIRPALASMYYEPHESTLIAGHLRSGDRAVDVGANVGYYTMICADAIGKEGKVWAVEPAPKMVRFLKKNIVHNHFADRVAVMECAAGRCESSGIIHLCMENAGDNRLWEEENKPHRPSAEVKISTVDNMLANELEPVRLMKVDVQGWEIDVLLGAENTIRRSPGMALAIEFWPWALTRAGGSAEQFVDLLFAYGFSVHNIVESTRKTFPVDKEDLLDMFGPDTQEFANLWCLR